MRVLVLMVLAAVSGCMTCGEEYGDNTAAAIRCQERKDADWNELMKHPVGAPSQPARNTECTSHRELNGDVTTTCK